MTFAFVRVRAAELIRGVPVRRRQLERSSGHATILDSQAPDDPLLESLQDILGHLSTGTTKKETPAGDMPRTDKRPGKSTAVREVESPPTVLAVPMENVNMGGVNLLNSRLDKSSDYNSCTKTGKLPERPQMRRDDSVWRRCRERCKTEYRSQGCDKRKHNEWEPDRRRDAKNKN